MIDVLNSQMDLQDIEKHSGLTGNHSADFLAIVNKMLSTVWLSDVSNVLAETLEADELTEAGGCGAGLVTSSIIFCCFFTIMDRCKKVLFFERTIKVWVSYC